MPPKKLTDDERRIRTKVMRDAQARSTSVGYRNGPVVIMNDAYKVTPTYRRLGILEVTYASMRIRRRAYVCTGGEVMTMNDEGYTSITDAFVSRPANCKYCVFEKSDGGAILINMFELMLSNAHARELTVKPNTDMQFPSVDAAIMYALTIE